MLYLMAKRKFCPSVLYLSVIWRKFFKDNFYKIKLILAS